MTPPESTSLTASELLSFVSFFCVEVELELAEPFVSVPFVEVELESFEELDPEAARYKCRD